MRDTQMICPGCLKEYTLGINGVLDGCDECRGITRNSQGLIIYGLPDEQSLIKRYMQAPKETEEVKQS